MFLVLVACLALTLFTGIALAASKTPAATGPAFAANAKITVKYAAPGYYRFDWTAATGTIKGYTFVIAKTNGTPVLTKNTGTLTFAFCETLNDGIYPWVAKGTYNVTVSALNSSGAAAAQLTLKSVVLK